MLFSVFSFSYCIHKLRLIAFRIEHLLYSLRGKDIRIMDDIIGNIRLVRALKNTLTSDELESEFNHFLEWRVALFFMFAFVGVSIVLIFVLF